MFMKYYEHPARRCLVGGILRLSYNNDRCGIERGKSGKKTLLKFSRADEDLTFQQFVITDRHKLTGWFVMRDQEFIIASNKQDAEWSGTPVGPDLVLELFADAKGFGDANTIDIRDRRRSQ